MIFRSYHFFVASVVALIGGISGLVLVKKTSRYLRGALYIICIFSVIICTICLLPFRMKSLWPENTIIQEASIKSNGKVMNLTSEQMEKISILMSEVKVKMIFTDKEFKRFSSAQNAYEISFYEENEWSSLYLDYMENENSFLYMEKDDMQYQVYYDSVNELCQYLEEIIKTST